MPRWAGAPDGRGVGAVVVRFFQKLERLEGSSSSSDILGGRLGGSLGTVEGSTTD